MERWKRETLYHCGNKFYTEVFRDILSCQKSLHLEVHFLDDQKLGRKFLREILGALERGITVRMVVDGFFKRSQRLDQYLRLFVRKGGQLQFFHPLPWKKMGWRSLSRLNKRSHKKVILIDEQRAYVGSFNVDTRQMPKSYGGEGWREIGVALEGAAVAKIMAGFKETWDYCSGHQMVEGQAVTNSIVRLNHKGRWRREFFRDLVAKLEGAESRIWICNPYFVPNFILLKALIAAVERGVEVKILVPQKSDLRLFPLINSIFYRDLVKKGVEVYEYLPCILHAKMMVVDQWMMMGSSNLNSRTQKHDWEIDIVLTGSSAKSELIERLEYDFFKSKKISYGEICRKIRAGAHYVPFLRAIKYFL